MVKKPLLSPAKYMFDAQLNYLVDAGYGKIYMAADCGVEGVITFRNVGVISFAIQAGAVKNFISDHTGVSFEASFDGRIVHSFFPWESIHGIYPPEERILHIPLLRDPWGIESLKHSASAADRPASVTGQSENTNVKSKPKLHIVD